MRHTYSIIGIITLFFLLSNIVSAQSQTIQVSTANKPIIEGDRGCSLIDSIIDFAKTKLGCAYRSGGTGPSSFDCSGFMYYTFDHFGIKLGRSSRDQIMMGQKVAKQDVRPGDLVFWYRGKGYVGHSGMVVSVDSLHNFTFIHSSTHGKGVRLDKSTGNWYASTYAGARRIIDCNETQPATVVKTDGKIIPAQTSAPAPKYIYHKIKDGETLSTIAKKYHVTVKQIKQWNHLKSDFIRAGNKLKIQRK